MVRPGRPEAVTAGCPAARSRETTSADGLRETSPARERGFRPGKKDGGGKYRKENDGDREETVR